MGTIYHVACKQCKIKRDLDKFYTLLQQPATRDEALEFADRIEVDSFRSGLLVGFMGEHMGHECVILSDLDWNEEYDDYAEEIHFWDSHTFGGAHDRE